VIPFAFVLDELADLNPLTRPMFGCVGVYVRGQIVFALREKDASPRDNGVWFATSVEHHASLREEFPALRSIAMFGKPVTGWQVLGCDADDFEEQVLRACALVRVGDARIGKVPGARKARAGAKSGSGAKTKARVASKSKANSNSKPKPKPKPKPQSTSKAEARKKIKSSATLKPKRRSQKVAKKKRGKS
jgi:hypothetical protein